MSAAMPDRFRRLAPWIARVPLAFAAVLFTLIALKYLTAPVANAAADAISLGSVMAISRLRVAFGGFPLALACILVACLLSPGRVLDGLIVLSATLAAVIGARLTGIALDGAAAEAVRLLGVEIALFGLSIAAMVLERARLRSLAPISTPAARS
jgi:hypothetical protein